MNRIVKILLIGLIAFVLGWFSNQFFDNFIFEKQKLQNKILADSVSGQIKQVNESLITDLKRDKKLDSYFNWKAKHADTTNYLCELQINDEYLSHWFHGQCTYYYFTQQTSDTTLDLLWSYKTDCLLNMDFLEKSHGIKECPKKGDIFATYTLINDTTLKANYYFPKWTRKINEIAKDSLFATYYYLGE